MGAKNQKEKPYPWDTIAFPVLSDRLLPDFSLNPVNECFLDPGKPLINFLFGKGSFLVFNGKAQGDTHFTGA